MSTRSRAYLAAARGRGRRGRAMPIGSATSTGDLVAIAPTLDTVDLVALDRVVCCYPRHDGARRAESATLARRRYGLGLPARHVAAREPPWRSLNARFRLSAIIVSFLRPPDERGRGGPRWDTAWSSARSGRRSSGSSRSTSVRRPERGPGPPTQYARGQRLGRSPGAAGWPAGGRCRPRSRGS